MTQLNKCNQIGCLEKACYEVFWPGKNPAPQYCRIHTEKAEIILEHMGVEVVVRRLDEDCNPDLPRVS